MWTAVQPWGGCCSMWHPAGCRHMLVIAWGSKSAFTFRTHLIAPGSPTHPCCLPEMEHLMQRVDINHDGVIQLTEFVAGLVDWKQLQSDSQWGAWVQVRLRGWLLC